MTQEQININAKIVFITKEIAKEFLSHNTKNRNVNRERVLFYRRQMEKGEWKISNDDIAFDINGNLLNGQHRLIALVDSSCKGFWSGVKRGLEPESQNYMDCGRKRRVGDAFAISGIKNANSMAAGIRNVLFSIKGSLNKENGGGYNKHSDKSAQEYLDFYSQHKEKCDQVYQFSSQIYTRQTNKVLSKSSLFGLIWELEKRGWDDVVIEQFFTSATYRNEVGMVIFDRLYSLFADIHSRKISIPSSRMYVIIAYCFNSFVTKKDRKTLVYGNIDADTDFIYKD